MLILAAIRASGPLRLVNRSLKLIPLLTHQEKPVRMAAGRHFLETWQIRHLLEINGNSQTKPLHESIEGQ